MTRLPRSSVGVPNESSRRTFLPQPMKIDGYATIGTERDTRQSAEQLLEALDSVDFTATVIAPEDRKIAVFNTEGNDRVLKCARRYPDRLIPACSVNPWFGEQAIHEFRRAVGAGACLLVFAPALQGFLPNDGLADELCRVAAELDVPIYIHSGPHAHGSPAQIAMLALQHPRTRFILGHGGSTDHAYDLRPVLELRADNLWFETSFMRPWAFDAMSGVADESRWIFGSSAPRNDLALELKHFENHWPIELHQPTYGQNLLDVLGLDAESLYTRSAT